ncbi:rabenosyn-5 [Ceratitis capitata]|uniref:Rabenosyn-5 n=1 Tax=Ceratitis capitata TaxID=7213 RepID=W8C9G8_CERCA|nr:rabenosyn-5 [Ceratitis capitata]XP_020715505.1 rabenosyn-5 [Ceratitis capitata]
MSNPFGEPDDDDSCEILEGFLCPICREDLKSAEFLTVHFERSHAEQQDALKSVFKDIISKAKSKILNIDETFDLSRSFDRNASIAGGAIGGNGAAGNAGSVAVSDISAKSNARSRMNVFNFMDRQAVGAESNHLEYFQSVRNPRLERYASETNKLIIRLHKLLTNLPMDPVLRKQHERNIVTWLDGSSVKLCPSCAKNFHIARRQHHCRLCGSIMCNDCSKFLSIDMALELASLATSQSEASKQTSADAKNSTPQHQSIRCCDHCLRLLEARQEMHQSRTYRPLVSQIYADIQQLRKDVMPDIEMYLKIVNSLYEGESIFTIADASALRGKIGQIAEAIDLRSKRILAITCQQGSREEALKKSIRLSCIQLIKDKMLSIPPLPAEEDIRKIQDRKRMEAEQRIETERRHAMEAYERQALANNAGGIQNTFSNDSDYAYGSDLRSIDNWSAHPVNVSQSEDPLIEQINIIKGYIKQARQEMNFEVVETLELNLRELQREFYERQRTSREYNPETGRGNPFEE